MLTNEKGRAKLKVFDTSWLHHCQLHEFDCVTLLSQKFKELFGHSKPGGKYW